MGSNTTRLDVAGVELPERALSVYYDGACPLCSREIDFYRRRRGGDGIDWVDVSTGREALIAPDLTRADALARFHVRLPDGSLESGPRGFGQLWAALPGFRWLGRIACSRAAQPLLELGYRGFLKLRPALKRSAARTDQQATGCYRRWIARELRSDHAGETGAVAIYRGVLAVSRCPDVRAFAHRHLETESRHLDIMRELVPRGMRSKLLPLWYGAGFITGALPALLGSRFVYATIEVVETFVDEHYAQQIERLESYADWAELRSTLIACREDELDHRDEAHRSGKGKSSYILRLWLNAVAIGSAGGVVLARRV